MRRLRLRSLCLTLTCGVALYACQGSEGGPFAGCGLSPIPSGFPAAERIENAGQARLTSSGIDFLAAELPRLLSGDPSRRIVVPVPRQTGTSVVGLRYTICPDETCALQFVLESAEITLVDPNIVDVQLQVAFESQDADGTPGNIPVEVSVLGTCQVRADSSAGTRPTVLLTARYALSEEPTRPQRAGYTTLRPVHPFRLSTSEGFETEDLHEESGQGGCTFLGAVLGDYAERIIEQELSRATQQALDRLLCQPPDETGCPTGTSPSPAGVCVYDDAPTQCVPTLLGADGQGNPSGVLLGAFSPGARGFLQTLLAAGGDGANIDDGISLFFFGGIRSTDATFTQSPAHDPCVPERPAPSVPIIPRASTLVTNEIPGTSTPMHAAYAISESFLNYASYYVYDSGGLCLAAGAPASPQLHTGVVTVLIDSVEELAHPRPQAPIAIALRPQLPPQIELGDAAEPDVLITANRLVFDFYVYSLERYVRVLSLTTNATIPLELEAVEGAIQVRSTGVTLAASEVSASEILPEPPGRLASALEAALPLVIDPMLSDFPSLSLPGVLGFDLAVLDDGVRTFEQGGDAFLAVHADFREPAPAPVVAAVDTTLELLSADVDPRALALETWDDAPAPSVRVRLDARGGPVGARHELSVRLDGMAWSPWSEERELVLSHPSLRLSARHVIEARARVVGEPATVDPTPASVELIIDARPPDVWLEESSEGVRIAADDVVSSPEAIEVRYTFDGRLWTAWEPLSSASLLPERPLELQARDEAGNVGSARSSLIRGLPDPSAAEGCGCRAAGSSGRGGGLPFVLVFGCLAALFLRRRRPLVAALGLALAVSACDGPVELTCDPECPAPIMGSVSGSQCCDAMCVDWSLDELCPRPLVCESHEHVTLEHCTPRCQSCITPPPLEPGMLATHLSATTTHDGRILVAGYDPGRPGAQAFGDLVVGLWGGGDRIDWEIVDGVPDERPAYDVTSWRGGVGAPGDDVGMWASAARGAERVFVAYYDATHGALKIAHRTDGAWQVHAVDDEEDSGAHAAIAVSDAGVPAVAYRRLARDPDAPGRFVSSVVVAVASSPEPTSADDWTLTVVASEPTPCRPEWCEAGQACLADGACATPSDDCGGCTGNQVCVAGTCASALRAPYVEPLPPGVGLYADLAFDPDGELALVYYDRTTGTLFGARQSGEAWEQPFAIAGRGAGESGDCGMGASLAVDRAGDWHVSYIDASFEELRHARVRGDDIARSSVDDGSTDGTARNPDGRHLVGDDSAIAVIPTGEVRIVYQDATAMQTRIATRAALGDPWVIRVLDAEDFTGFFTDQVVGAGRTFVVSAFRGPVGSGRFGVRVLLDEPLPPEP